MDLNGSNGNIIQGNYLGTNASGTNLANASGGIRLDQGSQDNIFGGTAPGEGNVIAFNPGDGIRVGDSGTPATDPADRNTIRGNSMYANTGVAIVLNGFANDGAGDPDTSANEGQNPPTITGASAFGGYVTIDGTLATKASSTYEIDFFSDTVASPQGRTYLGYRTVSTDGTGNVTFSFSIAAGAGVGDRITATATAVSVVPATENGNTSPLSNDVVIAAGTPAVTSAVAEISPTDVTTGSSTNLFAYDILATIGGGDTGVNRVTVTVPATFGDPTVTDVKVGGVSVAYTDNTAGKLISIDLTAKITSTDNIQILFTADAPGSADPGGQNFTSTVDDAGTPEVAQSTTEGNADGDGKDGDSWTVTTTDGGGGGLLAHWNFDEGSGQTAADSSGNGNDGMLGTTPGVDGGDPTWTCVGGGSALEFDGTNDEVRLSSVVIGDRDAWTISAWIKIGPDTADQRTIYSEGLTTATEYLFLYVDDSTPNARWYSVNAAGDWTKIDGSINVEDNQWHLVTMVQRSKTDHELYVDGAPDGTDNTHDAGTLTFDTASIGYLRTNWVADPFKGSLEDVRIYDYALSPAEISALAASPPGPCGSTISGTIFEDVNYGGGAGRNLAAAQAAAGAFIIERDNVTVELYDAAGTYISNTATAADGTYSFTGLSPATYTVRVVNSTVTSTRTGSDGSEVAVQSFRSDGDGEAAGTGANKVGGEQPIDSDSPANSGAQSLADLQALANQYTQSIVTVDAGSGDVSGVDFGFNFDTIVNTNDANQGSLRQFILNANLLTDNAALAQTGRTAGVENSIFMIPGAADALGRPADPNYSAAPLSYTISPAAVLPTISDPVAFDGTTQPDFTLTPIIELNGSGTAAGTVGLTITAGSSIVRGLAINRFPDDAIRISGGDGNTIAGNHIGTDVTGTVDLGTGNDGVDVSSADNVIGGTAAADRNVISGNAQDGISITGAGATGNLVQGNYVGVNVDASATIGNGQEGIRIDSSASGNTIGGVGAGNVIAGNTWGGIRISGNGTDSNIVQGNWFGTNTGGVLNLGQGYGGVEMDNGASSNTIGGVNAGEGNVIAFSDDDGVLVYDSGGHSVNNAILGNRIFANDQEPNGDGIGIDLAAVGDVDSAPSYGITANDAGDADTGIGYPNEAQNYPVLTAASTNGTTVTITGTLNSVANTNFRIEFFANSAASPSGHGEGERYLGSANVTTDGSGDANFSPNLTAAVAVGEAVSATATRSNATFTQWFDTSEFAANVAATAGSADISGAIFEDINYGGGNGRDYAAADTSAQASGWAAGAVGSGAGVVVELYENQGGNFIKIDDTTTDAAGDYSFADLSDGTYRVRVVNSSVLSNRGSNGTGNTPLAVQTFRNDPDSGGGVTDEVGGASPSSQDAAAQANGTNLASITAQSVTEIVVAGADVTGVDFGFNFDTIVNTNDSAQGSLRQFILNSNELDNINLDQQDNPAGVGAVTKNAGDEHSIFMIPASELAATIDGGGGTVMLIQPSSALPAISDGDTALDGSTQTAYTGDTNNAVAETTTGPEVIVDYQGTIAADIISVNADFVIIDSLGLTGNDANGNEGIEINIGKGNAILRNNTIFGTGASGIKLQNGSANNQVLNNVMRSVGVDSVTADGFAFGGNNTGNTISGNQIIASAGYGIDVVTDGGNDNNTISNNLIKGSGTSGSQLAGIAFRGGDNNTIRQNTITENVGAGIFVNDGDIGNLITQNSIFNNGALGADMKAGTGTAGDGVTANDNLDPDGGGNNRQNFPVITSAIWNGVNTVVQGTLNSTAGGNFDIELFSNAVCNGDTSGNPTGAPNDYGEGEVYRITVNNVVTDGSGNASFNENIPVNLTGQYITATAINTATDDTSEFSQCETVVVAVAISGTVYEDVNGDSNLADGVTRDNVTVALFRDGGDNQPDSGDDTFISTTTTDGAGVYSFAGLTPATYWLVVDSRTVSPGAGYSVGFAQGDVWPEQTYGIGGSWCADGAGGTAELGAAGACYGGQKANTSDDVSAPITVADLATAEHVTRVVAAADVNGVDFGFSFNTVVNLLAGDAQDDDIGNNRTVQGSLRQFIQNANAVSGANAMRFVPAVTTNATSGGNNWWRITVTSTLPIITGANTTLDGTAYSRVDGSSVRNDNPTVLGTGGSVGLDGLALSQVPGPELEIVGNNALLKGFEIQGNDVTIRRFAIYGFGDGGTLLTRQGNILLAQAGILNTLIEANVLGSSAASFTDPGAGVRTGGANIWVETPDGGTIQNNLIGFGGFLGIFLFNNANNWTVENNEVRANGLIDLGTDGIDINAGSSNAIVRGNLFEANNGSGVDMFNGGSTNLIENNTIRGNGIGGAEDSGIRVYGDNHTIRRNIITANAGSGIMITNDPGGSPPHEGNQISQNAIYNNGKIGVDLHTGAENIALGTNPYVTANDAGDPDSGANLGQNFPAITSAVWNGANTVIEGTLNSTAGATFNIEIFSNAVCNGDASGTPQAQNYGEGQTYRITANNVVTDGSGNATFSTNIPVDLNGLYITATSTNTATDDTSEFSACVQVAVPATIEFELGTASDQEATGGNIPRLIVNGTLTTDQTIEVNVTGGTAATPADFTNTAIVTIPAGTYAAAVAATINLSIVDDGFVESDETIDLQLANPATGLTIGDADSDSTTQNTNTYTILNDDEAGATVQMAAATSSVAENAGAAHSVTVQLNTAGALGADVTVQVVDLATGTATEGAGNDYTYSSPTVVTFAAGSVNGATQTVSLTPLDDPLVEGSETVNLQLQNATGPATILAGSEDHQVTITDDDNSLIEFQIASSGDVESSGGNIPRLIVNGTLSAAHTIDINVTGGSAVGGTDFNNVVSVIIPAGNYSGTAATAINLTVIDDTSIEPNETIDFALANPSAGLGIGDADADGNIQNTHTYTILDDDSPIIEFRSASTGDTESGGGNIPELIIRGTVAAPATIDVTVTGGSATGGGVDYTHIAQVNIPAGIYDGTAATALASNLSIVDDTLFESDETIVFTLANPSAGLSIDDVNGDTIIQTSNVYTIVDDENSIVLRLTKIGNKTEASIGDVVTYTIEISNTIATDIINVTVSDQIPPDFKYLEDSARLNGSILTNPSGNRPLLFNIGTVPGLVDTNGNGRADPGEPGHVVLRYQLIVGAGASPGEYSNTAVALSSVPISNSDSFSVNIIQDPLLNLTTIIGKVFMDKNRDGWQDPGEKGVAGAMVALDDGTYALTDEHGRYHFPAVNSGQRLVKINLQTLGPGAVATTGESVVLSITPGLLAKANFGVIYETETERIGRPGQAGIFLESQVLHKPIQLVGGAENLALLINGEAATIPTDNVRLLVENLNEVVEIKGTAPDESIVFQTEPGLRKDERAWRLNILDARGKVVRTLNGKGSLPKTIRWDGRFNDTQTIKGGEIYQYQMEVQHADGSRATSARKLFGINQTTAIFLNLTGEAFIFDSAQLSPKAKQILKETAVVLRKFPQEKVIVEGHTDSVGTDAYNMDLSRRRAESALAYLVNEEQLPQERFVVRWYGESRPLASNEYDETRALNRRIEIKGQVDDIKRSRLYDQYRTKPSVRINGKPVEVDSNGRFSVEVADKSVKQFEIEVVNMRGQSYKTTIAVPSIEILSSEEKILLPYGESAAGYHTGRPSTVQTPDTQTPLVTYDLRGKTEPGNAVEIDGAPITVMPDGNFQTSLALKRGQNPYGLLVRNRAGVSRIVNLMVTVNDQDQDGQLILATGPAPNLVVELPPRGVPLTSDHLTVSGATDLDNHIFINDKPVKLEINGHFSTIVDLPKGKSLLSIKAVNPEGQISIISREVEVTDTRLFFLAFADGKVENLWGNGYIEGAGMDKDKDLFTEGRIAFYLKGVIKGKYLIKAALDTGTNEFDQMFKNLDDKENVRLLTNLDPDKIYPVYGDSSTVIYDTESQAKFYLALDSDELHVLLGNYALNLNDTELAAYQRTLFGARIAYQSVSKTQYSDPDTKIAVFGAQVDQIPISDSLRATGGSLYYLSHREVIEGSEQVTLVIRDKDTGLVLARLPQEQNVDYTIKYDGGRILFTRPIASYVENDKLINRDLLPGSDVFIQVDYEAREDMFENTAAGGRLRRQIGDHVAVGGTYVKDELDTGDYELQGVDVEVRLGKNTRLVGEYAESSGTDAQIFISNDGGITYAKNASGRSLDGSAWKIAAEIDVGEWFGTPDRYQIGGYFKQLDSGFFSSDNFAEEGTEKSGVHLSLQLTTRDKVRARYDRVKTDAGPVRDETHRDIGTLQWVHDQGWWSLTGEYQYDDVEDQTSNLSETSSYAAARLTVKPTDKITAKAEHQQTVTGTENNQTTAGLSYQVHPALSLEVNGATATDGESAWGGAVWTLDDHRIYLTERLLDNKSGRSTATVVGTETQMGPSAKVFSEYQWEHSEAGDLEKSVLGAQKQWDVQKGLKLTLSGEYASADSDQTDIGHFTIAGGLAYVHPSGFKFTTREELRKDTGDDKLTQFLTSNFAELKLNPDFTALGKFRYSKTFDPDTDDTEADFTELSLGLAFRPVGYDRFNALAKYTLLYQEGPQEIGSQQIFRPHTQVAAIDWSFDVTRWLEWVEKVAFKINTEEVDGMPSQTTHSFLSIHRLNFNIWGDFDLGAEYRMLFQNEADDKRQGWLTELMWEPVDHFRIGAGYNFTDFSDNEFSDNDYSAHGLFLRFQAKF